MKRTRAMKSAERLLQLAGPLAQELDTCPTFTAEALLRALYKCNMVVRINPRSPRGKRGKEIRNGHRK